MSACVWKIYGSAGNIEVLHFYFTTFIYAWSGVIYASAYFKRYAIGYRGSPWLESFGPTKRLQ
jgi:hypothetical protein